MLTPNFDGVDDVASVTYRLTKRARVFAFATDAAGQRVYVGTQELLEPGEYREVWDGANKERPLPDGEYQLLDPGDRPGRQLGAGDGARADRSRAAGRTPGCSGSTSRLAG